MRPMPLSFAIVLGLVQALTEFLPVSSSGHLVLFQQFLEPLLHLSRTPLAFDVFVHTATLSATILFLRADIASILRGLLRTDDAGREMRRLAWLVILGSIPAAAVGLGFRSTIEQAFESETVVACGFLITSIFLLLAHRRQSGGVPAANRESSQSQGTLGWPLPSTSAALLIGAAQALAITPGISRSGSTICTALLLGLPTTSAIRFSFLLALPAIGGATLLEGKNLLAVSSAEVPGYLAAFATAFLGGLVAIQLLVHLTRGGRLNIFAAYTACLALLLFVF